MDALQIRRMHARYLLPASLLTERSRLDRILEDVVESGLDDALTASSVPDRGEVCIRSLAVPVRLRLGATDRHVGDAWSAALLAALDDAIARGGLDVARYPSRAHGFVELAGGVVRGDLRRAWAWRQLGIWTLGEEASAEVRYREAVHALTAEPEMIVPVFGVLARAGLAAGFLAGVGDAGIVRLAREAIGAAGADPGLISPVDARDAAGEPRSGADVDVRVGVHREAGRLLARGLGVAALDAAARIADPAVRQALAVLVALDADPAGVRTPSRGRALVAAIAAAIAAAVAAAERAAARRPSAGLESSPEVGGATTSLDVAVVPGATSTTGTRSPSAAGDVARPDGDAEMVTARRTGHTSAGGVLFLLHVVDELGLPSDLAATAAFAGRPVRWWLHRLAMTLADLEPTDPAALAFAGLAPGDAAPSDGEPAPLPRERRSVARVTARLTAALESRLGRCSDEPGALVAWVCARPAEILAEPGWIEVRFDIASVDTDVRRAGLDLDPGYLPWLGSVVRFSYG
jgi:hypothetical protein